MKLNRYLSRFSINLQSLIFLLIPVFLGVFSTLMAGRIYKRFIYGYINQIEIIDISNLERISSAVQKVSPENLRVSELAYSLNMKTIKTGKTDLSLPPLENIIPPAVSLPQHQIQVQSKRDFKVQAVYISDRAKFAVIDGKIYREGDAGNLFKVIQIDTGKVQIETIDKEKVWLKLD